MVLEVFNGTLEVLGGFNQDYRGLNRILCLSRIK